MSNTGSTQHTVNKIILLATGAPGGSEIRDQLTAMYEANGDWSEVATVIDDYMNGLLAQSQTGIAGIIQAMARQGFGVQLSLAEAQVVTDDLMANGIDSWSGLFAWLHDNSASDLEAVWNNRAVGADEFTNQLESLGKTDDYKGAQALAAAREWVSGIGASESSVTAASQSAAELIGRFVDGKVKGTAIDGYVAGATIFIDANGNGVHDEGEPITVTDANGDFFFSEDNLPAGSLVGSGGVDLATGLAFEGSMSAPGGASVISPLTTLVQQMMANDPGRSQADIEDSIFITLGVPRVDLSSFDPIKAGLDTSASRESQVTAAKIQAVTSQLVNLISVSAAVTEKLAPGTTAGKSSINALASAIKQASADGKVLSLSHAETVAGLIKTAAQSSGAGTGQAGLVEQLSTQAGQTLQGVNGKTQQAVDALTTSGSARVVDALSDMYKLQKLTQTDVSPGIRTNTSDNLQTVVDRFTGTSLDNAVRDVQAGNLTAGTPTSEGNVTRPETTVPATPATRVPVLALAVDTGASATDSITSNGSVTVSNLIDGGSWEYSLDGTTWTLGASSSVAVEGDGAKSVSVRQADASGQKSAVAVLTFTLDTTAPEGLVVALHEDTGSSALDKITRNGQVNFDLTELEIGASWEYSLDGNTWLPGDEQSMSVEGDGDKEVWVRQTDVAGNVSVTRMTDFTLDTTAPEGLTPTLHQDSGSSTTDGITNNREVDINTGVLEANAIWQYTLDGELWQTGSGSTVAVEGQGEHTVTVRQVDRAGNASAESSVTFTLDTMAPAALGVSLREDTGQSALDGITKDGLVNFDLTALEDGATWQYSVDGETWSAGSGSSIMAEGDSSHTVSIRQIDVAGNIGSASSVSFTLDTTLPGSPELELAHAVVVPAIDSEHSDTLLSNSRTVLVSGLEEGAVWEFRGGGYQGSWQAGTGNSVDVQGDDGEIYLQVRQIDLAGNTQEMWREIYFTLDTTAPDALSVSLHYDSGSSAVDGVTNFGVVDVGIGALEENATWQYRLDGKDWEAGSGSSVSVEGEGDGEKTVTVRQLDQAGNASAESTLTFTLDTTAPSFTQTPVMAADETITIQANETVTAGLYRVSDNTLIGSTTLIAANTSGSLAAVAQAEVTHAYIRITDAAGNSRVATVTGNIQDTNTEITADIRVILGTDQADTITGLDDRANMIFGFGGDDELRGAKELTGQTDYLHGGDGNDRLLGDDGFRDHMFGGLGDDYLELDNAFDTAHEFAGEGDDTLVLQVDGPFNTLPEFIERLTYLGHASNRLLTGNALDNVITGNNTNDIITGGLGGDILDGGPGADRYVYLTAADSSINNTGEPAFGFDVVTVGTGDIIDFNLDITSYFSEVNVDFATPLANGSDLLNQLDFAYSGTTGRSTSGVFAMAVKFSQGDTYLMVDADGDQAITSSDLIIKIVGSISELTLTDGNIGFGFDIA